MAAFMIQTLNFPVIEIIYPKSGKFVTGEKMKAIGELKLNDSPKNSLNILSQQS